MANTWKHYLSFIGSYLITFLFLEIIPVEIDFFLVMGLGAISMLLILVYLSSRKDFNPDKFYKANLLFTILFCGITILYDTTSGLTDVQQVGDALYFSNSKFYEWTLTTNHAILISIIFLVGHLLFTKQWKSSLFVALTILVLAFYLWMVV